MLFLCMLCMVPLESVGYNFCNCLQLFFEGPWVVMIFSPALVLRRCNWLALRGQHVCCVATHLHRLHAEAFRVQEPDRERAAAEDLRPALFQQPAYFFDVEGACPAFVTVNCKDSHRAYLLPVPAVSLKNGLRLPQPRTIRGAYCLSPAGPAP